MDNNTQRLLQVSTSSSAGPPAGPEMDDIFFQDDRTVASPGTTTYTTGFDWAGADEGLIWFYVSNSTNGFSAMDTARGSGQYMPSYQSGTGGLDLATAANSHTFTSTGVTATSAPGYYANQTLNAWAFKKQSKFFDLITYVGDGNSSRTLNHSLGSVPGFMVAHKYGSPTSDTSGTSEWSYHRSAGPTKAGYFWESFADATSSTVWNDTAPTSTQVTVGSGLNVDQQEYFIWLWAHEAGGFGYDSSFDAISCSAYTGDGSTSNSIVLGWKPQFILIKNATTGGSNNSTSEWVIIDSANGVPTSGNTPWLSPSTLTPSQTLGNLVQFTSTGFTVTSTNALVNGSGNTYNYVAIRESFPLPPDPNPDPPTDYMTSTLYTGDGTSSKSILTGIDNSTDSPKSLCWIKSRTAILSNSLVDSVRGVGANTELNSDNDGAAGGSPLNSFDTDGVTVNTTTTVNQNLEDYVLWNFKATPGFFDIVTYTGDGSSSTRAIAHNLGSTPGCIIVKSTSGGDDWVVWHKSLNNTTTGYLLLEQTGTELTNTNVWKSTAPDSSNFYVGKTFGSNSTNQISLTYIAYIFADDDQRFGTNYDQSFVRCGSYASNNSSSGPTINLGWDPQWLLIKRISSGDGGWNIFDTARGIVTSGNDPLLQANAASLETNTVDYLELTGTGFQLVTSDAQVNSIGNYAYVAIRGSL